jgi:[protein-PII] uridylyltransferase
VVDAFGLAGTSAEGALGRAERQRIDKAVLTAAG